jgi:hypothetical protein
MFNEINIKSAVHGWRKLKVRNVVETSRKVLFKDQNLLYFEIQGYNEDKPDAWTGMYTIVGSEKIQNFFNNQEVFIMGGLQKVKL